MKEEKGHMWERLNIPLNVAKRITYTVMSLSLIKQVKKD